MCGPDGCGGVCGTCEEGLRCIEGMCSDEACPAGTLDCGGVCTELLTDADNCGSCGSACPRVDGLVAECIAAECFNTCPALSGQGANVDLTNDPGNCGACGTECPAVGGAAVCEAGACVDPCVEQGLTGCGEECIDTTADPENCGGCDNICPTAENGFPSCVGGECQDPCEGNTNCNGVCVATEADPDNCGGCGIRCHDSQTCNGGVCECPMGGGQDLSTDVENCGACENSCPEIQGGERACNAGNCADACGGALNECNGACVNLAEDVDNCGACDNSCADYTMNEPEVHFWLEEVVSSAQATGCLGGECLFAASMGYRFPNQGGTVESCAAICAAGGGRCVAQPVGLQECPTLDGEVIPLGQNAVGCAVFRGIQAATADAVAGCQDPILPRKGIQGDNRVVINCACEATNPPQPAPELGIPVEQSGGYRYEMASHEILVIRLVAEGAQLRVDMLQPGYIAALSADGEEIDRDSELNFGPFVVFDTAPGRTYYVTYRTFPERAQEIAFEVDLNF